LGPDTTPVPNPITWPYKIAKLINSWCQNTQKYKEMSLTFFVSIGKFFWARLNKKVLLLKTDRKLGQWFNSRSG
jgi:hypothetical protein